MTPAGTPAAPWHWLDAWTDPTRCPLCGAAAGRRLCTGDYQVVTAAPHPAAMSCAQATAYVRAHPEAMPAAPTACPWCATRGYCECDADPRRTADQDQDQQEEER